MADDTISVGHPLCSALSENTHKTVIFFRIKLQDNQKTIAFLINMDIKSRILNLIKLFID